VALVVSACGSSGHHQAASTPDSTTLPATTKTTNNTTTTRAVPVGPVHWTSCTGSAGPSGYQCATVMVPRNPSHPNGQLIGMAIDRHPATGARIGSLLVNPGGPGASGVDFVPEVVQEMPSDLLARFDVVGFDPPGVDRTAPIECLSNSQLQAYFHVDPAPTTSAGFAAMVATDRQFAAGCEKDSGAELPYVSTVDAAEDMDILRQDLGDAKLTYLGFSYGTFLGATYAGLFPTHIRAMVLDGALDPALSTLQTLDQQSVSLEGDLEQFLSWCDANQSQCGWNPGTDPTATFEALLARVRQHELPVSGSSRSVGPAELLYGTAAALYSTSTWDDLGAALQQASQGTGTYLLELFDDYTGRSSNGTYSNLFEANAAVNCLDEPPLTLAQIQADGAQATAEAPIFGLTNLDSEASCAVWPVPFSGTVGPIHAAGSPPIVVVGSTGDPATPYAWAQALAGQLDNAVLLTRIGEGHTAYGASSCIRSRVDTYLIDLTPPPPGLRCPSD
jgi:pimeloyl-ACP methyl ester carboxylesterase